MKARRSPCVAVSPAALRALPDERLAELAREGSEAAFEVIVARHRRTLVRLCAQILGEADAEEAVQEALLKAHAAIIRGDQVVRTVDPWLRTIARNTGLNMLRARGSRPTVPDDDAACSQLTDGSVEQRQKFQELLSAVVSLPARQREAMVLREFEGRSYEEIGARLGASDGAVRQLLNRARGALRTRLGGFAGIEPVLRWLVGTGGVEGTPRLGALSGGCAITIKVCASALPAVLVLASTAPVPKRAGKAHSAAPVTGKRPSASAPQVTRVGQGTRAVFASVSLRPTGLRSASDSLPSSARRSEAPGAATPIKSAARPTSGPPVPPAQPAGPDGARSPQPQSSDRRRPAMGAGTARAGQTGPIGRSEASRTSGHSQGSPEARTTSSAVLPVPGASGDPAAPAPLAVP